MTSKKRKTVSKRKRKGEIRTNALCDDCPAKCCHKLLIPFNKPRTGSDIEYYRWHLQYDTVSIAVRSHRWYLVIEGRCIYLDENDLCTIYDRRPDTCRLHNPPDCEHYGEWCDRLYETPEELQAWYDKEKAKRRRRRKKAAARRSS